MSLLELLLNEWQMKSSAMGQETTLDLFIVLLSFLKRDLLHDILVHLSPLCNI